MAIMKKKKAKKKKTATKRRIKIVMKLAAVAPAKIGSRRATNRSYGDCEDAGCPTQHPTRAGYYLSGCSKNLTEHTVTCWYSNR